MEVGAPALVWCGAARAALPRECRGGWDWSVVDWIVSEESLAKFAIGNCMKTIDNQK